MLQSEGYRMFYGTATVTPKNPDFPTVDITGTWLYKPQYDCWYVNGWSYPNEIVSNIREQTPPQERERTGVYDTGF